MMFGLSWFSFIPEIVFSEKKLRLNIKLKLHLCQREHLFKHHC